MATDSEKYVKEGYLWLPPHGVLSQLKKSWQKKYCQLFKASKYGIERLEVFENEEESNKTSINPIITLENCIKITQDAQKNQPFVFLVVTKTSVHHFAANSEEDMCQWISALQSVAFKDNVSRQTIEEDNDLYCSSGDAGIFSVKLVPSDASDKCGLLPGPYTLVVTPAALQLRDSSEQHILYTWPYRYIRRYGYRSGKFTFEAGRKCESGEGTFHMEHSNQQEIFRCISSKMKSMKKLLTGESIHSSSTLLCGDNQFHAALGMMARSRSPLPPSPTGSMPILDSELCALSTIKPLMPLPIELLPRAPKPPPPPLKPKPLKPPRKNPPNSKFLLDENDDKNYKMKTFNNDIMSDYDDVEVRNEAWKTMGVGMMTHTERPFSLIPGQNVNNTDTLRTDNTQRSQIEHHYDKLQHLSTKSSPKPGYRQINNIIPTVPANPVCSETSPIEEIQAVRAADDSHLGYGIIRKKSIPSDVTHSLSPPHQVYNELEYAVICKPNRV
uniref:Uncharacterized protein n=1 Tax=Clastoptera arizonana TaxID=38151 RepID=A0A1B6CDD1_9HEMI